MIIAKTSVNTFYADLPQHSIINVSYSLAIIAKLTCQMLCIFASSLFCQRLILVILIHPIRFNWIKELCLTYF